MELNNELNAILEHLPGWELDPKYGNCAWQVAGDGLGHGLHFNANGDRLLVSGTNWPRDVENHTYDPQPECARSITVARSKPAEKIAADIKCRLIDWYLGEWEKQATQRDEANARLRQMAAVRARFVKDYACRPQHSGNLLYGPNSTLIDVQGPDSVRLECRGNFSVKQMRVILRILKKAEAKDA